MIDIIILVAGLAGLAACIWGALGTRSVEERYLDTCRRRLSEMEKGDR